MKSICATGIVAAIGITFAWWYFKPPARNEPRYRGRSLTKWLKQLDDGQAFGISSSSLPDWTKAQFEAAEAVRSMGTNALPFLMEDIHARPSTNALRIRFRHWADKHLPSKVNDLFLFNMDVTKEDRTRWRAAQGLAALGPLAKPELPELRRLFFTNYWHSSIKEAAYALAAIGPEGVNVLTNAVQPKTEWSGMCAIWALGQHPETGTNYIPFFIKNTKSLSEGTAEGSIEVLGLFHADPEQVIPILTNLLTSTNTQLSERAANALGRFGHEASPAPSAVGGNDKQSKGERRGNWSNQKISLTFAPANDGDYLVIDCGV